MFDVINNHDWSQVSIDKCHAAVIYGAAVALKPTKVLEVGIGAGFVTKVLLAALEYNTVGQLTSVDNWNDWSGAEPEHVAELRRQGCNVVVSDERKFAETCTEKFDLIMVDGNHRKGGKWADKFIDMLNDGGILFAHDLDLPRYSGLLRYRELAEERRLNHFTFGQSSLPAEMCHRGLIMITKKVT